MLPASRPSSSSSAWNLRVFDVCLISVMICVDLDLLHNSFCVSFAYPIGMLNVFCSSFRVNSLIVSAVFILCTLIHPSAICRASPCGMPAFSSHLVSVSTLMTSFRGINLSFASKSEAATSSYYGASITSIRKTCIGFTVSSCTI